MFGVCISGFNIECGDDRKIPTLRQVFSNFPNTPINIDVKVFEKELFHKVHL